MTDHPETEIQFIRRIVAMLLSLAGIAERAANRSYPVRTFLLWILRRAETAAQDFVGVEDLWADLPRGNGPTAALDLAASFRELAAFLRDDLEQEAAQDRMFRNWWAGENAHAVRKAGIFGIVSPFANTALRDVESVGNVVDCVTGRAVAALGRFGPADRTHRPGFAPRIRVDSS